MKAFSAYFFALSPNIATLARPHHQNGRAHARSGTVSYGADQGTKVDSHHPYGVDDDDGTLGKDNGEKKPTCSEICDGSWGPVYRRVSNTME